MSAPQPSHAAYEDHVRALFEVATFVRELGVRVVEVAPGRVVSELRVEPRHAQQDGFVHAGVIGTIADHTAGGAAVTLVRADQGVLTIEYKLNLLRPAKGARIVCRSSVLRAGRTITVAESEVFIAAETPGEDDRLIAKASVTLAIVQAGTGSR